MSQVLLDRYALDEVIGTGGAASVYRAVDRTLDRVVAVKLLDDGVARTADPQGRDRFLHEATAAAHFQHPNLVTVYDAGEDDGDLFLVMEYVEGRTLADVIAEQAPLPVDEATSIATQMLRGLAAVHAHGTIHRDVKPANVLVGDDGRVRLTDFGIAKRLDHLDAAITSFGSFVGTPWYLAPEQVTGATLSPATDVYQVGLVLHEMLTGVRAGGSSPAIAATAEAVDPRRVRGDIPDGVAATVIRATQRDPDRRFDSAEGMLTALTGGAVPSSTTATSAGAAAVDAGAAAMGAAGVGRTRTMAIATTTDDGATRLSGSVEHEAGDPATRVATPTATPALGSGAVRTRRHWVIGGVGALVIALLGVLALADGDDGPPVPGTDTSILPATTVSTPDPAVATAPPAPPPTAQAVVDDGPGDEPSNGNRKGNGKGKGKKKND